MNAVQEREELADGVFPDIWMLVVTPQMIARLTEPYSIVPQVHDDLWRKIVRWDSPATGGSILRFFPLRPSDV